MRDDGAIRVFPELPAATGPRHVVVTPVWFTLLLRLVSIVLATACVVASVRDWTSMPVWARVLVIALVIAFMFAALHPRGWARFSSDPFLVADADGLFLPELRPIPWNEKRSRRWLFVPWTRIRECRIGRYRDSETDCEALLFDTVLERTLIDEFLPGELGPSRTDTSRVTVAAYVHRPPHPRRVFDALRTRGWVRRA